MHAVRSNRGVFLVYRLAGWAFEEYPPEANTRCAAQRLLLDLSGGRLNRQRELVFLGVGESGGGGTGGILAGR